MPHDAQPASGTGLMQGTVTRIVTMIHITHLVFQTIQNHFLEIRGKNRYIRLFLAAKMHRSLFFTEKAAGGRAKHKLPKICLRYPSFRQVSQKEKRELPKVLFIRETQQRPQLPRKQTSLCEASHPARTFPQPPVQISQTKLMASHFSKLPHVKLARKVFTLCLCIFSRKFCKHNSSTAHVSLISKSKAHDPKQNTFKTHKGQYAAGKQTNKKAQLCQDWGNPHFHPSCFSCLWN